MERGKKLEAIIDYIGEIETEADIVKSSADRMIKRSKTLQKNCAKKLSKTLFLIMIIQL
jgi:hypothetical protein